MYLVVVINWWVGTFPVRKSHIYSRSTASDYARRPTSWNVVRSVVYSINYFSYTVFVAYGCFGHIMCMQHRSI